MKRFLFFFTFTLFTICLKAQVVWEHVNNNRIYNFLDELASEHIITINSAIKPYTRQFIALKLLEVKEKSNHLNLRQKEELEKYLKFYALESGESLTAQYDLLKRNKSFNALVLPPSAYYRDSIFRLYVAPVAGRNYEFSHGEYIYHNRGGGTALAYAGNNIGVYANVRDNYLKNSILSKPNYLTTYEGGIYKINEGGRLGGDYSEMRGGITYSWNWGSIGLVKDHNEWGDNQNGAGIISPKAPSYSQIKIQMSPTTWFDFNYFHGWLVSMIVDSSRSYTTTNGDYRKIFTPKYIAANMFSIRPFKHTTISAGNSIVYSDMNPHPAYLNPFMFYKSIDHTINANIENQNSQMFLNLSIRNIKKTHLYASVFIDEWSFSRLKDKNRRNFTSIKTGFTLNNLLIPNTFFAAEFTQTNPLTYKHRVPAITFASNNYGLGHYLVDNARDFYLGLSYTPLPELSINTHWSLAQKGNNYPYVFIPGQKLDTYPFLETIIWQREEAGLTITYEPFNNIQIHAGYLWCLTKARGADGKTADYYLNLFGPSFYNGNNHIIKAGLNISF